MARNQEILIQGLWEFRGRFSRSNVDWTRTLRVKQATPTLAGRMVSVPAGSSHVPRVNSIQEGDCHCIYVATGTGGPCSSA